MPTRAITIEGHAIEFHLERRRQAAVEEWPAHSSLG